jgi:ABC-type amino acid transport substrate-binding protein
MRPHPFLILVATLFAASAAAGPAAAPPPPRHDLPEILAAGRLRHLGAPYAGFVTGAGEGLDVELVQLFCRELGVEYVYVETDRQRDLTDLTGLVFTRDGDEVTVTGTAARRGDLLACGPAVLPWREKLADFAAPMFPTQVWLIAPATARARPIAPTGNSTVDIERTLRLVAGVSVMVKPDACLEPERCDLAGHGALEVPYEGSLEHVAPNLLSGMAEMAVLDAPSALVALRRWEGKVKVLGPLSPAQHLSAAFAPDAPQLAAAFAAFLDRCRADGTYENLLRRYYPGVWAHFPGFFPERRDVQ